MELKSRLRLVLLLAAVGLLCCLGLAVGLAPDPVASYTPPELPDDYFFAESFDRGTLDGWVLSSGRKADNGADTTFTKYDGKWVVEEMMNSRLPGDKGLVLKTKTAHHAISARLRRPFVFDKQPLIVQYEVSFQNGLDCSGAYIKLLTQSRDLDLDRFTDRTPYTIMFGPDKCGDDFKLHFIFQHKNPKTGELEEKHAKKTVRDLRPYFTDKKTHLYTLVLDPDNSFQILVDQEVVKSGSLLMDVVPSVNGPREIVDPDDVKPADWDDRIWIPDAQAVKPNDWDEDEPKEIPDEAAVKPDGWLEHEPTDIEDPHAEKPADWDDEMDGEWAAPEIDNPVCADAPGCGPWRPPTVPNPRYRGKWKAPKMKNPAYRGEWHPRTVPNPDYVEDLEPFKMASVGAVGLELWSTSSDIFFDNFLVVSDRDAADQWAAESWRLKKAAEDSAPPAASVDKKERDWQWRWARYALAAALPLLLLVSALFTSLRKTRTNTNTTAAAAEYKKTDEPQPDVKDEEEEDEEEEEDKKEEDKKDDKEALKYLQTSK